MPVGHQHSEEPVCLQMVFVFERNGDEVLKWHKKQNWEKQVLQAESNKENSKKWGLSLMFLLKYRVKWSYIWE